MSYRSGNHLELLRTYRPLNDGNASLTIITGNFQSIKKIYLFKVAVKNIE